MVAPTPTDDLRLHKTVAAIARRLSAQLAPFAAHSTHDDLLVTDVHRAMGAAMADLAELDCWGPSNQIASSHLWNIAGPYLRTGALQWHAKSKPHGYAGDFEMLHRICNNQRQGVGLAWALDDYFQQQAAPTAVRNRSLIVADSMAMALDRTSVPNWHIVSLGSGPAYDLELLGERLAAQGCSNSTKHLAVTLVDLDPRALGFAVKNLDHYFRDATISCERLNLKRIVTLPRGRSILSAANFLSCPGFFDYLDHDHAASMLGQLWGGLRPGGELLVFAFSQNNPSRAYMEWIGNWYLVYRSLDQMHELAQAAGIPRDRYEIDVEPAGVNLFLHARKG